MGLVKKCDKCKRYYRLDNEHHFHKIQIDKDENLTWSLCNRCTCSFIEWMKGRILKGENE